MPLLLRSYSERHLKCLYFELYPLISHIINSREQVLCVGTWSIWSWILDEMRDKDLVCFATCSYEVWPALLVENKMIPNDILLHSQISALLSHHQGNSFLQQIWINTEKHRQKKVCRAWDLETFSSKLDVSIKSLPSEHREPCRREGRKRYKSQKEWKTTEE